MTGLPHQLQNFLPPVNKDVLCLLPAVSSSGPESVKQSGIALDSPHTASFSKKDTTGTTGQVPSGAQPSGYEQSLGGACAYPQDPEDAPFDTEQFSDIEQSGTLSDSEDEQLSDSTERPEQAEDMTYRETVRSVRAFMGWHHIPTFETDYSEPDKSNNPWKGKHPRKPTRISVAMPPDD